MPTHCYCYALQEKRSVYNATQAYAHVYRVLKKINVMCKSLPIQNWRSSLPSKITKYVKFGPQVWDCLVFQEDIPIYNYNEILFDK